MESIPRSAGIYQILCIPTGKVYIGSTVDLHHRWVAHRSLLRRGANSCVLLQRAWNKYGEAAFEYSILECVLLVEMLTEHEQYWLDRFQSYRRDRGFNTRSVADRNVGLSPSAETREKIRQTLTGTKQAQDVKDRRAATLRGRKLPPHVAEGLRLASIGRKHTDEQRAKNAARGKARGFPISPEARAKIVATVSKWYVVTSPGGEESLIKNLRLFSREHDLIYKNMLRLTWGKERHHRGWQARLATVEEIHYAPLCAQVDP